jgi:hypothetical protein
LAARHGVTFSCRSRLSAWALCFVVLLSCVGRPPTPGIVETGLSLEGALTESPATAPLTVSTGVQEPHSAILIVLDGVRPREIFEGVDPGLAKRSGLTPAETEGAERLMPTLHLLMQQGMALGAPGGAPMRASGPHYVSLPGYTEIMTGRTPARCPDNSCAGGGERTLADDVRAQAGATDDDVAVIASWEHIERAASVGRPAFVLSTGRHHGVNMDRLADDGVLRSALSEGRRAASTPGTDDFRPDRFTAALGLRYLALRRPRFLFLGLGEPDEYAHHGDYRGYLASLRSADETLRKVVETLAAMGPAGGAYTIVVTADHGRADSFCEHGRGWPESGRTWMVSAGGAVPSRGIISDREPHRLADITPTLRVLLGLASPEIDQGQYESAADEGKPITAMLGPDPSTGRLSPPALVGALSP